MSLLMDALEYHLLPERRVGLSSEQIRPRAPPNKTQVSVCMFSISVLSYDCTQEIILLTVYCTCSDLLNMCRCASSITTSCVFYCLL